jgi:hypothetical protein
VNGVMEDNDVYSNDSNHSEGVVNIASGAQREL